MLMNNNYDVDFKASLNPEQLSAVENTEGPLLVLAGAGTGKTKVLTSRIANILLKGVYPSKILAVTFTNKAAREMAERVSVSTGGRSGGIWLGTFHSIATRILRAHAEEVGLKPNFIIIDTSDQLRVLKQVILEKNIDEKKWNAKKLAAIIGSWKDKGLMPDKVSPYDAYDFGGCSTLELYKVYQSRLTALNVADFGDLLLYNLVIFQKNAEVLKSYQEKFQYILVDEYQDTNLGQYLWLRLLAQGTKNICCVGDDDQSIYGWRGAEVGNILKFERDFKGAKVIRLERNYRSTSHILTAASGIIAHNKDRLGKSLWTESNGGEPIKVASVWDDREEASFIANEIEALQQLKKHPLSQMAVLVRAGFQTRAFEERFIAHSIPYKVIGGLRFYERAEIKDIIAYLRIITQSSDDLAFERVINTPKRGVGDSTLKSMRDFGRNNGNLSLLEAARAMLQDGILKGKIGAAVENFVNLVDRLKDAQNQMTVTEFVEMLLKESGYLGMLKSEDSLEAEGRIDNLKELLRALEEFESVGQFLEHVSLVSDVDTLNQENMVAIMTIHAAKGLEFETVFLPGWEEGIFPSQRSVDESGAKGVEEERRLAYVAITRAKKRAYIIYAANRRVYNQYQNSLPSRFLKELPEDNIEKISMGNGLSFKTKEFGGRADGFEYNVSEFVRNNPSYNKPNIEKSSKAVVSDSKFYVGVRVFHVKFGYGRVVNITGNQLDVNFEKSGNKKVIESYVEVA